MNAAARVQGNGWSIRHVFRGLSLIRKDDDFTLTVNPASTSWTVRTVSLPDAIVGSPYAFLLRAPGGAAPYTCAVSAPRDPPRNERDSGVRATRRLGVNVHSGRAVVARLPTPARICCGWCGAH